MEFQFFPLDITYKIEDNSPVIYIFGRTADKQQICIIDDSFKPYFWVVPKKGTDLKIRIKPLFSERNNDRYEVLSVEEVKKKLNEQEVTALKVTVNVPKAVPAIKEILKDWDDIESINEYDILFTRRYLIDKQITPLTTVTVKGEPIQKKLKIPAIKLESIEQLNDDAIKEPNIIALDIETYNQQGKIPDPVQDPIIMLALYGKNFKKVITWKKFKTEEKYVEFVNSEADLLDRFKELIDEQKPDFLTGYFSDGFDLPFIATRAKKYKIRLDLGLDYSDLRISGRNIVTAEIKGIVHVDILKFIKRAVSKTLKTDVYTLDAVANEILGEKKLDIDMDAFAAAWDNAHDSLNEYSKYNLQDAYLTYKLFENLWPNMVELVKVVGLDIYSVIRMSFSQLVEWYITKKAKELNGIAPNKPGYGEKKARMMKRIKGAFVYEPTPGLYNNNHSIS
jgi:DNA polymerase I